MKKPKRMRLYVTCGDTSESNRDHAIRYAKRLWYVGPILSTTKTVVDGKPGFVITYEPNRSNIERVIREKLQRARNESDELRKTFGL